MTSTQTICTQTVSLMGQAELPPSVLFGETEMDLWPYRRRTVALLRRYARASVEVGGCRRCWDASSSDHGSRHTR